jgi:hypothetical protein
MGEGISKYRRQLLVNGHLNIFERQPNHMSAIRNKQTTVEEYLEAVFSMRLLLWLRKEVIK